MVCAKTPRPLPAISGDVFYHNIPPAVPAVPPPNEFEGIRGMGVARWRKRGQMWGGRTFTQ